MKKSNREGTGKKHNCNYCNKLIPLWKKYCNRECYNDDHNNKGLCEGCGKEIRRPKNKLIKYCSITCSNKNIDRKASKNKAQKTLFKRYNTTNPFEVVGYNNLGIDIDKRNQKIKETINNRSPEEKQKIKEKISKSLLNKSPKEKQKIKEKKELTNLSRFGAKSILSKDSKYRESINDKIRDLNLERLQKLLEIYELELLEEYKGVRDNNNNQIYYKFKHIPSGDIFIDHISCGRVPIWKDPNETIGVSKQEKDLLNEIKNLLPNREIISNNRKLIKGFEIDIYIPELKLAIEYDGLRYHSEAYGNKNRMYHLIKTEKCDMQGIQLIHIFEDEWRFKRHIVLNRLKSLFKIDSKIYARKCKIKEISSKESNIFLNLYHIQGGCRSKINIGLYFDKDLIGVMTFGNLRKITGNVSKLGEYELLRYASRNTIVGGASRLFKYFIKNYDPKKIISYADRRYSLGNLYKQLGFKHIKNTQPNYWYMKYYKMREHRFKYRKSELPKLLDTFDPKYSEWDNMKLNKFDRIWDCGSMKFELVNVKK